MGSLKALKGVDGPGILPPIENTQSNLTVDEITNVINKVTDSANRLKNATTEHLVRIDADLTDMFKTMGYKISWDFSSYDGLHWHEFIDPISNKMVLQVEFGISKERFLEVLFSDSAELPPFFMAGEEGSVEMSRLFENLKFFEAINF